VGVTVTEGLRLAVADAVREGDALAVALGDKEGVAALLAPGLRLSLGLAAALGLTLPERLPVALIEPEVLALADVLSVACGLPVTEADDVAVCRAQAGSTTCSTVSATSWQSCALNPASQLRLPSSHLTGRGGGRRCA
jgi:hypothetical protein